MNIIKQVVSSTFMPHGHCYLWTPGLVWGHVLSDAIIAIAYYSIPVVLIVFVRRRTDIAFGWVFRLFALFILACGTGHLVDIWNVWNANYGASAVIRIVTAFASIATATALWPLLPRALAIPSAEQLRTEIDERQRAEAGLRRAHDSLEERVKARTGELEDFAQLAVDREDQMIALKQRVNALCAELGRAPEHDCSFLDATHLEAPPDGSRGA